MRSPPYPCTNHLPAMSLASPIVLPCPIWLLSFFWSKPTYEVGIHVPHPTTQLCLLPRRSALTQDIQPHIPPGMSAPIQDTQASKHQRNQMVKGEQEDMIYRSQFNMAPSEPSSTTTTLVQSNWCSLKFLACL